MEQHPSHVCVEVSMTYSTGTFTTPQRNTNAQQWIGHFRSMNECKKVVSFTVGSPQRLGVPRQSLRTGDKIIDETCLRSHMRHKITLLQLDLTAAAQCIYQSTERFLNAMIDAISCTNVPVSMVNALTLPLLICHYGGNNIPDLVSQLVPLDSLVRIYIFAIDWEICFRLVLYGILPAFWGVCGCVFLLALSFGTNSTEALLLSGLAGVIFMECLIPLVFTMSFGMVLVEALTLKNAAAVTVLVWTLSVSVSRNLRNAIYTYAGLD